MISFNNLGNLGRLANQMFQYASLKGISHNNGVDFCIPPRDVFGSLDSNVKNSDVILYDVFDLEDKNNISITNNRIKRESYFHFDEDLFNNCEDNVDLYGFFQSEKYFKKIENQVRKDFTFKEELDDQCKTFFDENFSNTEVISLHIRRGDYVVNENHALQPNTYYQESLSKFDDTIPVIIFSDDPDWCHSNNIFDSDRFFISNNSTDFDLCLMTFCDYHIIANSSYSWWGAWLSNSKKVIAPKNWFGGNCSTHNTKDLYCSNWIIL